ncbi:MAG: hypothetical protein PHV74_05750 [Dehalococcoidia bacterium]|nr:hypothetical protein [Dehalococcoidia bacterium]
MTDGTSTPLSTGLKPYPKYETSMFTTIFWDIVCSKSNRSRRRASFKEMNSVIPAHAGIQARERKLEDGLLPSPE